MSCLVFSIPFQVRIIACLSPFILFFFYPLSSSFLHFSPSPSLCYCLSFILSFILPPSLFCLYLSVSLFFLISPLLFMTHLSSSFPPSVSYISLYRFTQSHFTLISFLGFILLFSCLFKYLSLSLILICMF